MPGNQVGKPTDACNKPELDLNTAWEHLVQQTGMARMPVDLDHECVSTFERRLFEDSAAAGAAGCQQWGLDAGTHQEGWNPYKGLPSYWMDDQHECSDSELVKGPNFIEGSDCESTQQPPPVEIPQKRLRPRPRVIQRMVKPKVE
ncbi:hypothetical protein BDN67DRAFT_1073007 [Paxillus ammoniavirescens]|nr:hypothetical protein BDN67DRAFT_1073007 [Paxillus ammoniavirescens]